MAAVQDRVDPVFDKHPEIFGGYLRFSWDAHSAHESALPDIPLLPGQHLKPPLHSPDIQKAIELPHAWIHKEFNERLRRDSRVNSVKKAIKLLKRVVKDEVTKKKSEA